MVDTPTFVYKNSYGLFFLNMCCKLKGKNTIILLQVLEGGCDKRMLFPLTPPPSLVTGIYKMASGPRVTLRIGPDAASHPATYASNPLTAYPVDYNITSHICNILY